ncbi:N-acetyltransferase, partial [Butyricicoccus sp. 1XD8-22]
MVRKFLNLLQRKGDQVVRIEGDRCYLRTFIESDARSLSELLTNNKYYWAQYEPLHDDYLYTEDAQLRKILESMQLM